MRAIETTVAEPIDVAERAVRAALADEGFGVLTEIDVAATLRAKLGVDRAPLKILGACNPQLADRALSLDPSVALLLPCNVVLETVPGGTRIAAADPHELLAGAELKGIADDAADRLQRAIGSLGTSQQAR